MNARELYLAVGQIDEELIISANEQPAPKKKNAAVMWALASAACICLICLGAFSNFLGTSIVWNDLPKPYTAKESIPADSALQTMTWDEMKTYYQSEDIPKILQAELCLTEPSEFLYYKDEAGNTVYDRNQLRYENADATLFVRVSLTRISPVEPIPEQAEYSRLKGVSVLIAISTDDSGRQSYWAQWEQKGTSFLVTENGLSETEFIAILKELLN